MKMEIGGSEKFYWLFLALSFVGFLDASYLTASHYSGVPVICSVLDGCEKVTASVYSTLGNIPVALMGMVYYFTILFAMAWFLSTRDKKSIIFASGLTAAGFLASLWFVYLQLFVIKAICFYCMISAATSTFLFILGIYYLFIIFRRSNSNIV